MTNVVARIRLVGMYLLVAIPFIINGAVKSLQSNNNSPMDWVDHTFAARQQYDEFVNQFGPGDAVVASWPGCTWDDPRLDALARTFREAELFRLPDGTCCFHRVISGRETLRHMARPASRPPATTYKTGRSEGAPERAVIIPSSYEVVNDYESGSESDPPPSESENASGENNVPLDLAIRRIKGSLIGPDERTTCIILNFTQEALKQRAALVEHIRSAIMSGCDVDEADIHMAGPVIDGLTVDKASQMSLQNFAAPSSLIVLVICCFALKSLRAGLMVFLVAGLCQAGTLAVVHYSGESLSALLIILPPLIQVLAVAGGIHLTNYYFDADPELTSSEAAVEAFRKGWLPCLLSAATTAMGTASLMISNLTPIRLFGVYGTVGVLLTAASVLTAIPLSLMMSPVRLRRKRLLSVRLPAAADQIHYPSGTGWLRIHRFLTANAGFAVIVLLSMMALVAAGLPDVRTSVHIETLFAQDSRILKDYKWLESNVGKLVTIEILVTVDSDSTLTPRERMALLQQIEKRVRKITAISSVTSALTFFPSMPSVKTLPVSMRVAVLDRAVSESRPGFEAADVLRYSADGDETWRLTARCSAIEPLDFESLTKEVNDQVNDAVATVRKNSGPSPEFASSGIMPLVQKIQGQLLADLFKSLMSALLVITITMTIAEAGLVNGLLAMISNIFPIVILFGVMGWLQVPMDIGAVMTASVALGIAVDDTLHFLTFFRRGLNKGMDRAAAVLHAYQHCGSAMIQTSMTCGMGLLVFALSDFGPTSRFALLMVGLLTLALLGDLVLLPAIVLSPLGRGFKPSLPRSEPAVR